MKTELKAKLLQHIFRNKKQDEGFTLIELLVVIIIIGILSAIALPSFLNQANKAKQSEAKTYVGSMNRAQQAFYAEAGDFIIKTAEFSKLGLGVSVKTENYQYEITGTAGQLATNQAQPQKDPLKAYVGGVAIAAIAATKEATTIAKLCEADSVKKAGGVTGPTGKEVFVTAVDETKFACPAKYVSLAK